MGLFNIRIINKDRKANGKLLHQIDAPVKLQSSVFRKTTACVGDVTY